MKKGAGVKGIKTPECYAYAHESPKIHGIQQGAKTAQKVSKTAAVSAKSAKKALGVAAKAVAKAVKGLGTALASGGGIVVLLIIIVCMIGVLLGSSFGIFFSAEDTGEDQTLRSAITETNEDFNGGIESIKLENPHDEVIISGSHAPWKDVLAIYAVKTTTDTENGQEVVTMSDEKKQLLKDVFWDMTDISFYTETFYVGDDDTETWLYISITHKTAEEAAEMYEFTHDQMKILDEILSDEYADLWAAVLYGSYTGDGAIISVALEQVGNVGGEPYWRWYGFGHRVEWCACFVSWCADQCGYIESGKVPKFSSCGLGVKWFREHNQWIDGGTEPAPGMIIFFDWTGDGWSNHVGIVEKVEDGRVYTIEGNSGDACRKDDYSLGDSRILGYGTIPQ